MSALQGLAVHVNGTCERIQIPNELAALQKLVGGWIEIIGVELDGHELRAVLNEEGKLDSLPRNELATTLIGDQLLPGDWIAGELFFFGPYDDEGMLTDCPRPLPSCFERL